MVLNENEWDLAMEMELPYLISYWAFEVIGWENNSVHNFLTATENITIFGLKSRTEPQQIYCNAVLMPV